MAIIQVVDWPNILLPDTPILEIIVRGSIVYLSIYFLLRLVPKRQAGTVGVADLLVLVLISDAAQNAMAADYHSVPDGLILVATIVFWNYVMDWAGFRFPQFERMTHPPPLPLIKDGRMLRRNMKKELISDEELMSQLREQGVHDLEEVKEAYMEGDGRISVVTRESSAHEHPRRRGV